MAQKNLGRVVEVENEYNPDVVSVQKMNTVPLEEEPVTVNPKKILFARDVRSLGSFKDEMSLSGDLPQQERGSNGFGRLAAGNYGTLDANLYYHYRPTRDDEFTVNGLFDGFKGNLKHYGPEDGKWNSRLYRTDLQGGYRHHFSMLDFFASTGWTGRVFNYQDSPLIASYTDKQHDNAAFFKAGFASNAGELPYEYGVQVGYDLFTQARTSSLGRSSQDHWSVNGMAATHLDDGSRLSLDFDVDALLYRGEVRHSFDYDNYVLLRFLPAYTFSSPDWKAQIGAHIDILTANGKEIRFAPELKLRYQVAKPLIIYMQATGGSRLNDLSRLSSLSPYYAAPSQFTPTHTLYDATGGAELTPFTGAWLTLYGGHKYINDNLFATSGSDMNNWRPVPGYSEYIYTRFYQDGARALYAGAAVKYHYKEFVYMQMQGSWSRWTSDGGNSMVKSYLPLVDIDMRAGGQPLEGLSLEGGYHFTRYTHTSIGRANNLSDLSFKASYLFYESWRLYIEGDNLMGKTYDRFAGYRAPGAHVVIGMETTF